MNFAEDVQDLLIESVVGALKHHNPYTRPDVGRRPGAGLHRTAERGRHLLLHTDNVLAKCPTYRKDLMRRFARWLKAKYGTQDGAGQGLAAALEAGRDARGREHRHPGNPWFERRRPAATARRPAARLLDNAAFLHDVQNRFYGRFVKAIRATGYRGPLCGSPWQAPAMVPHYYNLRSDYLVGWIDRHNYFGGGVADTMLARPGSGYLGSGLQQVADRPFGISEWIHVYPSLYSAEGPGDLRRLRHGPARLGRSRTSSSRRPGRGAWSEIVGQLPLGRVECRHPHADRPVPAPGADGNAGRRDSRGRSSPRAG